MFVAYLKIPIREREREERERGRRGGGEREEKGGERVIQKNKIKHFLFLVACYVCSEGGGGGGQRHEPVAAHQVM